MARVDFKNLEKFAERLSKIEQSQIDQFSEAAIKELAARLLRKVIKRTLPYQSIPGDVNDHHGGTLRDAWTIGDVTREGGMYRVDVINPTEYASYVEFGHRGKYVPTLGKTLHLDKWTDGKFMLTISEQELERDAPRILEQKLTKFLGGVFK